MTYGAQKKTTLDEVLPIAAGVLRKKLQLSESECYVADDPDNVTSGYTGDAVWIVSPAPSGQFDGGLWDGGGEHQAHCVTVIVVTVHSFARGDEHGRSREKLLNRNYGLLSRYMKPVLKSLAGEVLHDPAGFRCLSEPMQPLDWNLSDSAVQFGFRVSFDWDLS